MQTYLSNRLELNFSDEELAMLSFDPLFRYERDETLRGFYRRAMDQWWQNIQREDNPLWIYIYAQANPDGGRAAGPRGTHAGPHAAGPGDLVGAQRAQARRAACEETTTGTASRRRPACWPPTSGTCRSGTATRSSSTAADGGLGEDDGAAYLLPYWFGRYYGYIAD